MGKTKVVGLNDAQFEKDMMKYLVEQQNTRLIEYAQKKVLDIGNRIASYTGYYNSGMEDVGNLLDSICWGVSYDGKLVGSGFYRETKAKGPSVLHAFSRVEFLEGSGRKKWAAAEAARKQGASPWSEMHAGEDVYGHQLAEAFIEKYGSKSKEGQWLVFFAVLAPYWGYWEKGFKKYVGRRNVAPVFLQFSVMAESYDQIKADLKPMKTRLRVSVATYASKSLYAQAKRNLKNGK